MSPDIGELAMALAKAQEEMFPAVPNSQNTFLKNKYADLNSVLSAVRPALCRNQIAFPQTIDEFDGHDYLITTLIHASGQWIRSRIKLTHESQKGTNANQALGGALSYARRYSLTAMTGVSQEDDDAVSAAPSNGAKEEQKRLEVEENRKMRNTLKKLRGRWVEETADAVNDILADYGELKTIESAMGEQAKEICERLTHFGTMMHEEENANEPDFESEQVRKEEGLVAG
tara:strand:+ start:65 stop:754 length:690 start_codon:yes stop_codon:yes gene_type:complete